jgi:large subunit ribosomal protein L23
MELSEVLRLPVITEKSTAMANPTPSRKRGLNPSPKYVFRVAREANKIEIRQAVQERFKVVVLDVNTMTVRPRERGTGKRRGSIPAWKKAIVTLAPGQSIEDFFGSL